MTHLSFDGYCIRHKGEHAGGGYFVSYGRLVNPNGHYAGGRHVSVYFVSGIGYQYRSHE